MSKLMPPTAEVIIPVGLLPDRLRPKEVSETKMKNGFEVSDGSPSVGGIDYIIVALVRPSVMPGWLPTTVPLQMCTAASGT